MDRLINIKPYIYNKEREERLDKSWGKFPYPNGDYGIKSIPKVDGTYTESYTPIPIVALSDSNTFDPEDPSCTFILHVTHNHNLNTPKYFLNVYFHRTQVREYKICEKSSLDEIMKDVDLYLIVCKPRPKRNDLILYLQRGYLEPGDIIQLFSFTTHYSKPELKRALRDETLSIYISDYPNPMVTDKNDNVLVEIECDSMEHYKIKVAKQGKVIYCKAGFSAKETLEIINKYYSGRDKSNWFIRLAAAARYVTVKPSDYFKDFSYSEEKLIDVFLNE